MTFIILGIILIIASILRWIQQWHRDRRLREVMRMRAIVDEARAAMPAKPQEAPIVKSFWKYRLAMEKSKCLTHHARKQAVRARRQVMQGKPTLEEVIRETEEKGATA